MSVFAITMGGVLGSPYPLVEFYHSDIKKAYQVGKIPLWTIAASNFISGIMHLFVMSLIILISAPIIFKAQIPENIFIYLLGAILFIIVSLSIGMVFLPSIMLSGIMFPVAMLPNVLQVIGRILPATWGFELMCTNDFLWLNVAVQLIIFMIMLIVASFKIKQIRKED